MYVEEECKGYTVPLKYLTPPLHALLNISEEALEPKIDGLITLPCTTIMASEEDLKLHIEELKRDGHSLRVNLPKCTAWWFDFNFYSSI